MAETELMGSPQLRVVAQRDQDKAARHPAEQHKQHGQQQQQQHGHAKHAQQGQQQAQQGQQQQGQQQQGKQQGKQKSKQFPPSPRVRVRSNFLTNIGLIFGFIQGTFAVIPTTLILSIFNTMVATLCLPVASFRIALGILSANNVGPRSKMLLLAVLPIASVFWPFIVLSNSIVCGILLGLFGPVYHVLMGKNLLVGGFFGVIKQAFGLVYKLYKLHGLSEQDVNTYLNMLVHMSRDVKLSLLRFWNSDQNQKLDTIRHSTPLQYLLRAYDWVLSISNSAL